MFTQPGILGEEWFSICAETHQETYWCKEQFQSCPPQLYTPGHARHLVGYHPKTITTLPLTETPMWIIIKHECSDTGRHCLQPEDIKHMMLKQINTCLKKHSIPGCEWLSQDFIPELIQIGEWRTYFISGECVLTICTSPSVDGCIICSMPGDQWSLLALTWVISVHSLQQNYNEFSVSFAISELIGQEMKQWIVRVAWKQSGMLLKKNSTASQRRLTTPWQEMRMLHCWNSDATWTYW
jgi:hypothetical protein